MEYGKLALYCEDGSIVCYTRRDTKQGCKYIHETIFTHSKKIILIRISSIFVHNVDGTTQTHSFYFIQNGKTQIM